MSTSTDPVVSVIIPTRNRHESIKRTLDAIFDQTLDRFEVIVVDDGADANALPAYEQILAGYDDRFRFEKRPMAGLEGTGPGATRNRGIRLARGDFLAFCDDDDWWQLPNHLAVGVEVLEKIEGDFYFTDMQAEDNGRVKIPSWFPDSPQLTCGPRVRDEPPVREVSLRSLMSVMRRHYPSFNTCIVRRILLEAVGLFWEPLRCAEDIDLVMRSADRARRIAYRSQCAVTCNVAPRDSTFTGTPKIDLSLYGIAAAQHVRAICRHGVVRRCARAIEAWNLRELARHQSAVGRAGPACALAWQAQCIYPTLGATAQLAQTASRAALHMVCGRGKPVDPPQR